MFIGGAGAWNPVHSKPALDTVKEAAKTGFDMLKTAGTAVDVVEAVPLMEGAETFNADCRQQRTRSFSESRVFKVKPK